MNEKHQAIAQEVEALCSELVDGTIDEENERRLELLVRENPVAKRTYIEYFNLHAALHHYNAANLTDIVGLPDHENEIDPEPTPPIPNNALFTSNTILPWGILIGVLAVAFLAGAWALRSWQDVPQAGPATELATTAEVLKNLRSIDQEENAKDKTDQSETATKYIAELIWPDAVKQSGNRLPASSSKLVEGETLRIQNEDVQVRFTCGALVTLHGPAVFHVKSAIRGELEFGSLEAKVPPQATGFLIDTPATRVIDLGTEFGLAVGENGETNVKVLDGEVETESRRPLLTAPGARRLLREGEALYFKAPLTESLRVDFDRPNCLDMFDVVRPDPDTLQLDVDAGQLTLSTQEGDIYRTANNNRNFLVLPAPAEDFEAILYVKRFMPTVSPQHVSLCVLNDQDNLYRMSYWNHGDTQRGFALTYEANAVQIRPLNKELDNNPLGSDNFVDMEDRPFRLRLVRHGDEISASWATETGPWIPHGKMSWDRQPRFVGFYAADGFYERDTSVNCVIDAFELKILPAEQVGSDN